MRIGDHLTLHPRPCFPHPPEADGQALRESYILTRETGEICARILRRLACYPERQPGGFFFTGERGVGKTHLLRYVAGFLADSQNPGWEWLHPYLGDDSIPRAPLNSIFVEVPNDPLIDLGNYLQWKLGAETHSRPFENVPSKRAVSREEFAAAMRQVAEERAALSLGILVLDDVSRRLDRYSDLSGLAREIQLLKILVESFAERGVLAFIAMDEGHLKREGTMGIQMSILDSLGESCEFIWLSRNHIAEIIATVLTSKSDAQKVAVRGVLNRLRRKLPHLGGTAENFIHLYPIHPDVFCALFHLRARLPSFSPLGFALTAIEDVYRKPDEQLITMDYLFDHVQNDLRGQFQVVMEPYDRMQREVIPLLPPAVQLKAQLLLKGITFLTLCESQAATVRSLANSLLIYDNSGFLPGYSLTSAILMQLEQRGARFLSFEGEKFERRYSLVEAKSDTAPETASESPAQDDEFPLQFTALAYEWLYSEVPAWLPDTSAKALRSSQSLVVSIPRKEKGPKGLVYLKSIFDPLWSREDLVSMEEGSFPWVLLILSPYERFYEYEQALNELGAHLSRLLIWHPDIPTADESDRLHKLSELRQALDPARHKMVSAQERLAWSGARAEANEILHSIYVYRGRMISASVQRCIGDEIKNQSLSQYLSEQLSIFENAFFAGVPGSGNLDKCDFTAGREGENQSLHWAALLSGMSNHLPADTEEARKQVADWWSQVEASGLSAGLQQIPDAFLTVQFWNYVKSYEGYLASLRPLLVRLNDADSEFFDAMAQVAQIFDGEEEKLLAWKRSLENLSGLLRWLPSFEHQRNYLYAAVLTGEDSLEEIRNQLFEMLDKPQQFLEARSRATFEQNFLSFKKGYIDYYASMHEDALQIIGNPEKMESKVDQVALRNLELLSSLENADKSYLDRIRIIGKWVQANQCGFPVTKILESFPRCYCNFSPAASAHLRESVSQMNAILQEGISYFRAVLRNCKMRVIRELKTMHVDDLHSRQIAALMSNGRMMPLEPQTVDILNRILQKHPKSLK